jgi:hypothetical protein
MSFLAPFFLIATLAAAIPVILHMIHRQRAKELPFSTLRFLRISVEKTRRRRRIHDLLLMLVRAGVLLLLALGLASPTVTHLSALWGKNGSAVAIILDNSASMGVIDKGQPRFQTAVAAVRQILDQLQDGDQVAMFLTGGREFPEQGKLDTNRQGLLQMLEQCAVSYERADLGMRIHQAQKCLADASSPNKQIFVVTDMQKHSWLNAQAGRSASGNDANKDRAKNEQTGEHRDGGDRDAAVGEDDAGKAEAKDETDVAAAKIPIVIVDCNREPKPNASVSGVEIDAAIPVAGVPMRANAEIFNAGPVSQQRIELYVDGAKEATSPDLSVPQDGRTSYSFRFTLQSGGSHRGEVRLVGEDGSKYDNRRFFAVAVDQGIPVAVVTPKRHDIAALDDTYYLQQALAPSTAGGSAVRSTVLEAKDLLAEPLSNFAVVYCVNLPAPDADVAQRLRKYVDGGGNLVWICGDNVVPEAYNQMNQQAQGELLPASLVEVRTPDASKGRDSWQLGFFDKKHRALAPLCEPVSLYQSVLVYKHVRFDTGASPGSWIMARLDDGEPLLAQRKGQRGSVTLLGTSVHVAWTNLPLRPIFLPLVAKLTFDLAGAEQAFYSALAGSPLVLPLDDETRPVTVEVVPPSGAQSRLPSKAEPGAPGQMFRYVDTHDVGFYSLRVLESTRAKQAVFAVNVDPEEASPAKIDREDLKTRLAPTELFFADDPENLANAFKTLREGTSLWTTFLGIVLVALVFEAYLSNRLTPKHDPRAMPVRVESRPWARGRAG